MGGGTGEQRIALERKLHDHPALRRAMRQGRVSYEKARLLAFTSPLPRTGEVEGKGEGAMDAWTARAEKMTCVELRRTLEAPLTGATSEASPEGGAQVCGPVELALTMPRPVADLLDASIRAARAGSDRWLTPGECVERISEHFIEVWKGQLPARKTLAHRIVDRDGGLCRVPVCSRAADQAHHLLFRSAGGTNDPRNLTSMCAPHHLHGIHRGTIRVSGEAPGALRWELGLRPGREPLIVVGTAR